MELRRVSLFLFFALLCLSLKAQEKITRFTNSEDFTVIGESVYVLEDKTAELDFEQVLKPETQQLFNLSNKSILNLGTTYSAFWLKFTVINTSGEDCFLEIPNASLEKAEFFIPLANGSCRMLKSGYAYAFRQREYRINTFLTKIIPAGDSLPRTVYVRIQSTQHLILPVQLATDKTILASKQDNNLFYGINLGLVLITIFYNIFIYILLKEIAYVYYTVYLICFLLVNTSYSTGYTFQYAEFALSFLNYYTHIPGAIGCIALIYFTSLVLKTRQNVPVLHKGLHVFTGLYVFLILLTLSRQWPITDKVSQVIALFFSPYLLITGIACFVKGERQARLYILAITSFIFSIIVAILLFNNVLPLNFFTRYCLVLGSSVETILLSLTLADRVGKVFRDQKRVEATMLKMIREEKDKLEELVYHRTEEILAQNEEITAQNEELSVTREQITSQRDMLAQQNEQLRKAQIIIEAHSQNLETEVHNRTEELRTANTTLFQYNQQLEQFAFITAHNLRSPVARILGLGSLLEMPDTGLQDILSISEKLVVSTRQLDEIIKDLNTILSIKKNPETELIWVNPLDEIQKIMILLEHEITNTQTQLTFDFSEAPTILSLPAYLNSILYNLIHNAIKYRHPRRECHIHIKTTLLSEEVCLSVADNGLGIDLELHKNKLFLPYKRFHLHSEGKGLGLYLVKTQVETLGGKIEIESQPEKGTTFRIYFPYHKTVSEKQPV